MCPRSQHHLLVATAVSGGGPYPRHHHLSTPKGSLSAEHTPRRPRSGPATHQSGKLALQSSASSYAAARKTLRDCFLILCCPLRSGPPRSTPAVKKWAGSTLSNQLA